MSTYSICFQSAPKDKLLVFKCSEGWEPLCKFLGVPIPNSPFPHRNIRGSIVNEIDDDPAVKMVMREVYRTIFIIVSTTGILAYCSYKYGPLGAVRMACNKALSVLQSFRIL